MYGAQTASFKRTSAPARASTPDRRALPALQRRASLPDAREESGTRDHGRLGRRTECLFARFLFMTERNYSLTGTTKDGFVTAPRWVHYLIRIVLGLLLAAPLLRLGWAPAFAWIPGTFLVMVVRRARIIWRDGLPIGFERWPFPLHFDDVLLDFSLNLMLMPIASFLVHRTISMAILASFVEIVLVAGFLDRYPDPAQ